MKTIWFLLTIFYTIIHQKHLFTSVEGYSLTDTQASLLEEFSLLMLVPFNDLNTPRYSLDDDDPPLEQNLVKNNGDENLILYNVVIDGLNEIEDDSIDTDFQNKREIHITVNLKNLVVHGEFITAAVTEGTEEKRPFSVTFTDVTIEAVAYLIPNNEGQMEVTKVMPSVTCGESQILTKSKPAPYVQIMQLVLTHVEKNVEKRFARIAVLEAASAGYNNENDLPNTFRNQVFFEARRFVSQRYDPYTIRPSKNGEEMLTWRMGPINLHGFSNFGMTEFVMHVPTNNSVEALFSIEVRDLYGNFSAFSEEACVSAFSIGKMEFIAGITLMADHPEAVPKLTGLGMEMTDCKLRLRNKATGMTVTQLGHDSESFFCLLIRSQISVDTMINEIQSKILNKMRIWPLKNKISEIVQEQVN